ncbi:dihydrofolate reductase family protein [Nonomuraea sp. SYSU D8015]|uniref:dihydrofolate reductase family protein n=1 Tax=Nonomuraea sp. SYSU D8015 TaxID=2593644 RepID=UPI0016601ED6|nr:dihydrofolate reductase family protein [Nonomuraea sp. SYSU D8015]
MSTVFVELSISLDGFIAGADDGLDNPLGDGGGRLFEWFTAGPESNRINRYFCPPDTSKQIVEGWYRDCGAMISGRRTFDIARGWRDGHPIDVPIFVLTHNPPAEGEWSPRVSFVTEGVERAVKLAKEAADGRDVSVSAAGVTRGLLRAGLLDEIRLSVVPCLLGSGVRLLDGIGPVDLEQVSVIPSDGVTHVRYRVARP